MTTLLTARILAKIQRLFSPDETSFAAEWLASECGDNLPFSETLGAPGIERIQAAVLKLSNGSLDVLAKQATGAQRDWRNTLMAAGFADDVHAHEAWLEQSDEPPNRRPNSN